MLLCPRGHRAVQGGNNHNHDFETWRLSSVELTTYLKGRLIEYKREQNDDFHLECSWVQLTGAKQKIICVGLNYRRHALEAGFPVPTTPVIFGKFANSLAGSGTSVALPDVDTEYDFEAELGVIIGRAARNVPVEAALDYVAGYCCANDLSARDAQLATSQWMIGKMLDGFLPLGPYLVTADTVKDPQSLGIRCRVNGELGARVRHGRSSTRCRSAAAAASSGNVFATSA